MNQILRMAASRIGYNMDSLANPQDPAYKLVAENFDTVVRTELENYAWHWSDSERSFPCYSPEENESQYEAFITLSSDIVRVRKVHQQGEDLRYDRNGLRLLLWRLDKARQVTVRGQWYNDIGSWPENFKEIVVCRFAGMMGSSLTQRPELGQYFDVRADKFLEQAKAADSQQQTAQRILSGRIAARRRTPYTSIRPPEGPAGGGTASEGGGGTQPGTGGGIEEAPIDGSRYGRKDQSWEADPIQDDAPPDDQEYVRKNLGWVLNTGGAGGVPEAPNDGIHKLRRTLSAVSTWENAGGAALLNVGSGAGEVAAGNAPALAVANHEADANPHGQYPLTSTLGNASTRDVGTGAGDVAQGDAPAAAVTAHEASFDHEQVKVTAADNNADYLFNQVQSGDGSIVFSVINPGGNEVLDMQATGAGGGQANTGQNIGTGEGLVYSGMSGTVLDLRTLKSTPSISVATVGNVLELTGIENPTNDGNNYARSTSVGGSSTWELLGDSALRNVGSLAGDVAAGNAPAAAVAVHEAAGNPHSQYPLSSSLGDSATRNVGTGAGDVAAGNAPASAVSAHESSFPHPTTDQKAAMDGANLPSGTNVFATSNDLPTLHASFPDLATSGHPGTVISVAGTPGNVVQISAGNTLEDSGSPPIATDLGNNPTATNVEITSSSGANTTIASATVTLAGMLSASDKSKLDGLAPAPVDSVSGQYSISASPTTGAVVTNLVNDQMNPGNNMYYGTNAVGTRGWFDLVTSFLGLSDTPGSYAGEGGKFVRVAAGETGLEFTASTAGNIDGQQAIDWSLAVQALGTVGGGSSNVDLDTGHHITATLSADHTINFTSTRGHAVTQWTASIATAGFTPTFQFGGVAVDLPKDYDLTGGPQRINFSFVRDAFGVSVMERQIP